MKITGSSPSLPLGNMFLPFTVHSSAVTVCQQRSEGYIAFSACAYVLCIPVTPEYAVEASGEDSRLPVMCSVPHRPASSGHYSAGNSIPVFWQTLAPPKMKLCLYMRYV